MAQSLKALKEDFVSGLSGGSISEVNYVTAIAPASYLLWSILQARHDFFARYDIPTFLVDFLLQVCTILLAITLYGSIPILFNVLLLSIAATAYLLPSKRRQFRKPPPPTKQNGSAKDTGNEVDRLPARPFITAYRGGMMIITCLAILAVDFRVFPRRFAKVETWGTSIMDMGVGSFVFSAGLVSARPILKAQQIDKYYREPATYYFLFHLKAALRSSLPLLALGLIRLYSVKGLDYAEHVTEYGVHWNFFFTLALLPPAVAFLSYMPIFPYLRSYIRAFLLTTIYQIILSYTSLQNYILTAPRGPSWVSKNREGIFSFLGYLAIFLTGQAIGLDILPRDPPYCSSTVTAREKRMHLLKRLAFWLGGWYTLFYLSTSKSKMGLGIDVSRRLADAPYVEWVVWFNCMQLFAYAAVETWVFPSVSSTSTKAEEEKAVKKATSRVLSAFNRNGLAIFLIANLLTGAVNLGIDTLNAGSVEAMLVLGGYAVAVTSVAIVLDQWNISIKL